MPTESELAAFGCTNIVISGIFLCLQAWYCKFVWSKRPGWGSDFIPTLHLLNAVCDISQLCCHFWAGVQCLFPAQYLPGSPVFGGLVFGTWLNGAFYMNFFVVHRFLFIFMPFRVDFIITRLVTQLFTAATLIFLFLYMCMSTTVLFISYSATALSWAIDWRHSWEPGYRFLFFINELSNYLYRLHKSQMKARDLYLIMQMLISWLLSVVCWFLWEVFYDQNEQDFPKYLKNSVAWMLWNGYKPLSTLITLGLKPSLVQPNVSVKVVPAPENNRRRSTVASILPFHVTAH
ncbi:unnamed protein product, partial [Mesorhabditis spiculigera]